MENTIYVPSEGRIEEIELTTSFNSSTRAKKAEVKKVAAVAPVKRAEAYVFEGGIRLM